MPDLHRGFPVWATLPVDVAFRARFAEGLWQEYAERYPELFDERDAENAASQSGRNGGHSFEWLGALVIFHATGLRSFIEKYQFSGKRKHPKKWETFSQRVGNDVTGLIKKWRREVDCTQFPDLFVYGEADSEWRLVDVKGPDDGLSDEQVALFSEIERVSGRRIWVLKFEYVNGQ